MELPVVPAIPNSAMRFTGRFVLIVLVLTASRFLLRAQQDPCLTRTIPVNVTTNDYRAISGLTPANFRGKFRGKPVEIVSVKYDTGPRRVVILMDASNSMEDRWDAEVALGQNLVSRAPIKDTFAVLAFSNGKSYSRIGFGQDSKGVVDGLRKLPKVGQAQVKTAMLDALLEALNMLSPVRIGDALLLISDGGENASESRPAQSKSALLASGVRLFALITVEDYSRRGRTPEEVDGPTEVHDLINAVGGDGTAFAPGGAFPKPPPFDRVFTVQDRKNMSSAASALGREISEFYAVEVKLPEAVDKPRDWQLEVVGDIPEKHRLRVVFPHRLAPCQ